MSVVTATRPATPALSLPRLSALLFAVFAAVLVVTGCSPAFTSNVNPINPANRPTTIGGYSNGYLPASQLYYYNSNCSLFRPAAGSFAAMIAAAKADGVYLAPAECYRDFAGQVYERKFWCKLKLCSNAATPGYSNHGWGKAVDLQDSKGTVAWGSPGYRWLVKNAGSFGWNHPGAVNEAWHWEWVGDGGTMHGYGIRVDLMSWAG